MSINHALSVRSDFSIGESLLQVDKLIDKAKELGYESVALVDQMSVHNLVDFTSRAKKAGIKPIAACRLRVYRDPTYRKPSKASGVKELPNPWYSLKVFVTGPKGIASLMKLLTKANSAEHFYYNSRCGLDDVLALEEVIITTGDMNGLFHQPDAHKTLRTLQTRFGVENVFVELCPIDTPLFDTLNFYGVQAAGALHAPTLVTYPTMYLNDGDADSLAVLRTVTTPQGKMSDTWRPVQYVQDFYFTKPTDLVDKVKKAARRDTGTSLKWVEGIKNIEKLADRCTWQFSKMPISLPTMAANEFDALGRKCLAGWQRRFSAPVLGHKPEATDIPVYKARLAYELGVLKKMGFAGYFLLVEDLVMWAKTNGIIVGPGRGSVGGSLVAYLIGITDVDPIRFDLLFERFINPDRLDLPDADLDFMSSKRHMVVEYLAGKYGADRVANISNFSTLASASAIRDVGRVFGLSGLDLVATKLVPKEHGQSFTITDAAKAVPELSKFQAENPHIWKHALKLEGAMRSFGTHAAGVVVGGEPLVNRAVIEARGSESTPVVVWDKRVVEDWGLVKMDILGLSTLDTLEIARTYVKDRHGVDIDYTRLPLEEKEVMEAFARGDTTGVFQFESPGMKKLLRDLAVGGTLSFEDVTAATALYRPGPMDAGLLDDFVQIKQGGKYPYYEHPNMEPALRATSSVIIYQEQVMQVAVDLAGFTRTEADHLRKAMGKKDKDKMAEMRDQWVKGCMDKSGMQPIPAGDLFDKIEAFAGYGFNRSHAVEYSIISYWCLWMRVNYPAEYFAACLSVVGDDKLTSLVMDARSCGIEVLPPDVNLSTDKFTITSDKHLLAPFGKVMGVSDNTAQRIVDLRKLQPGGKFASIEDFKAAAATKGSKVNVKVVGNLELVGALANLPGGGLPPRHPDRRKNQTQLMPGLIVDAVKADRTTDATDKFLRAKLIHIIKDFRACTDCDLSDQPHPSVKLASTVKFMVVSDCPSWQEEKANSLLEGDAGAAIKMAITAAGLKVSDGYYTTLVKAKKSDKFLSNGQINGCSKFLDREIEVIKPAVIVALGSAAVKRFLPGMKQSPTEMIGKVVFDKTLDASIVCGLNAQQVHFDPSKQDLLDAVFAQVSSIVS